MFIVLVIYIIYGKELQAQRALGSTIQKQHIVMEMLLGLIKAEKIIGFLEINTFMLFGGKNNVLL